MKKMLINVSNHPVSRWSDAQKEGWDLIRHIPFPNVDPKTSDLSVRVMAIDLKEQILEATEPQFQVFVCVQGEFSLTVSTIKLLDDFQVVFPTTERVVEEKEDGTKVSKFNFVQWRWI